MFEQFFSPVPIAKPVNPLPTPAEQYAQEQENLRLQQQLGAQAQGRHEELGSQEKRASQAQQGESDRQAAQLAQHHDEWRTDMIDRTMGAMRAGYAADADTAKKLQPMWTTVLKNLGIEQEEQAQPGVKVEDESVPSVSPELAGGPVPPAAPTTTQPEAAPPEAPPPQVTAMPAQAPGENLQAYLARWANQNQFDKKKKQFEGDTTGPDHEQALNQAEQALGVSRPPAPAPVFTFRDTKTGSKFTFDPNELMTSQKAKAAAYKEAATGVAEAEGMAPIGESVFSGEPTTEELEKERVPLYNAAANRTAAMNRMLVKHPKGGGGGGEGVDESKEVLKGQTMAKNEGNVEKLSAMKEGYFQANHAQKLLENPNSSSADVTSAIKLLVRASGDNRISDQDFAHTPGMQSLWDKFQEFTSKGGAEANYSPEEIARLKGLAGNLSTVWHDELKGAYGAATSNLGGLSHAARRGKADIWKTAFSGLDFYNPDDFGGESKSEPLAPKPRTIPRGAQQPPAAGAMSKQEAKARFQKWLTEKSDQ